MLNSLKHVLAIGASLLLCACSTVTLTPQKKAAMGRVGVTTLWWIPISSQAV